MIADVIHRYDFIYIHIATRILIGDDRKSFLGFQTLARQKKQLIFNIF